MSFDSLDYAVFLGLSALVLCFVRSFQPRALPWAALLASAIFYSFAGTLAFALLVLMVGVNYGLARSMGPRPPAARRWLLRLGVLFDLSFLASFKYAALIHDSWGSLAVQAGWLKEQPFPIEVLLPIGISFYTFECISFLVDSYKGLYPCPSLRDFALFVGFAPHLVAGPILRGKDLFPQIVALERPGAKIDWMRARDFLALGFFKKLVLADPLGLLADATFAHPRAYSSVDAWLGVLAFAFQIYFDFSGYSDIAEGSAALLGLRLAPNFRSPYRAASLSEFWRRWHLSLSTWLRDYLYIPLGGSRSGGAKTTLALLATMALGGLWHGASWTFLIWGVYHGLCLGIERALGVRAGAQTSGLAGAWRRARTFALVLFGWILFRSESLQACGQMLQSLAAGRGAWTSWDLVPALFLAGAAAFASWEGAWVTEAWSPQPRPLPAPALAFFLAGIVIFGAASAGVAMPFIYFRF